MEKILNNSELSKKLIHWITFFGSKYEETEKDKVTSFLRFFVNTFLKDTFVIPKVDIPLYLILNRAISNLFALSDFKNTDDCLKYLVNGDKDNFKILSNNHFSKILILYSIRNNFKLNYKTLFDYNKELTVKWYFLNFYTNINKNSYQNINFHVENINLIEDNSQIEPIFTAQPYFFSTYIDSFDKDKLVKPKINKLTKNYTKKFKITNKPKKNKIALVSSFWNEQHVIYRDFYNFAKELSLSYDLTFINLSESENYDKFIFKKIITPRALQEDFYLYPLLNNDYSMIYYPNIGEDFETLVLSNLRLAPIQITGYGHPVSTFGSEIDYYIAGKESEEISKIEENYTEKVILLDGIGFAPKIQKYDLKKIEKKNDVILIVCPWGVDKINYELLAILSKIIEKANKKIKFRFLPRIVDASSFFVFKKDLEEILGKELVEVIPKVSHEEYITLISEADFLIDSYPFGSYNCVRDAILVQKPIISFKGNKAYNCFASVVLNKLGLLELITENSEKYLDKILELINNDTYRVNISTKITSLDSNLMFSDISAKSFKKSIDYLMENHDTIKNNDSIKFIEV